MEEDKRFDYSAALKRLEELAAKVEDPSTGLDDIDKYIQESNRLIAECRAYLRSVKETI